MSRFFGLALAVVLALPLSARADDYTIDPVHSNVIFAVKHMMVSTVHGRFSNVKGNVHFDAKDPSKSTVHAVIDATTVNTDNEKRDGHLKSDDFFSVAKFPTITFDSTSVKQEGAGKLSVTGNLTIRDVTKSVVLEVEGPAAAFKSPMGTKSGATATTTINRKDFHVSWNKSLDNGGVVVADDVKIEIDLELDAAK